MRRARPFRAVIFDWDGTLLDSYHADAAAFLEMFHTLGIPWSVRDLERHYSPNWHRIYRAAGIPRSLWEHADRLWHRGYRRHQPKLLPGARSVLRALGRRYTLALVTSGNRRRVLSQLRRFGLRNKFAACVFAEDAARRKPHPAPLRLALDRLALPPELCIYVGDAPEDVQMARRAGVRTIGFLGPFPTHRRLRASKPMAIVKSLKKLPLILNSLGRRKEVRKPGN